MRSTLAVPVIIVTLTTLLRRASCLLVDTLISVVLFARPVFCTRIFAQISEFFQSKGMDVVMLDDTSRFLRHRCLLFSHHRSLSCCYDRFTIRCMY
ncbi:hypothetical protein F4778DRAFT_735221 [Xylariomycetidae sp. FL2044]|nr:hypothetical protein F4778DRAFT_735221 [Xylariomycetidae sp. FL2044]